MRAAIALLLAAGCAAQTATHYEPAPAPHSAAGPSLDAEPVVRVYLKSLGADWTAVEVQAEKGLRRDPGGEAGTTTTLTRADEGVTVLPKGGVFRVAGGTYSGALTVRDGRLINVVPLENYVLGVLRGELPLGDVPVSAAAAQAIAVRSYTLHYCLRKKPDFDVDDTTFYQRYVGLRYAPQDDHLRRGVNATRGLYLEHDGRPLKCYYHSTCGGHTTDVPTGLNRDALAPMVGVPCTWCDHSKYWRWDARLDEPAVRAAAGAADPVRRLRVDAFGPGARAERLRVDTRAGSAVVHAGEFRLSAGPSALRSTRILEIERDGDAFVVHGAGWGHGVGLCQMGAIGLARYGRTAADIVGYYYPGAVIRRAY